MILKTFIVERYELHTQKMRIEASCEAEAIKGVMEGEGDIVDNGLEYIETADEYGMSRDENPELADTVEQLAGVSCEIYIPGIRSVEEDEEHETTDDDDDDIDEDG